MANCQNGSVVIASGKLRPVMSGRRIYEFAQIEGLLGVSGVAEN